jgi:outer membrane protein, multidrug efflux system
MIGISAASLKILSVAKGRPSSWESIMRKLAARIQPLALLGVWACLGLTACVGKIPPAVPPYQRPVLVEPAELASPDSSSIAASIDWLAWWKSFQDPVLDTLLQEAAGQSQDLALASARIEEARTVIALNQTNFYPSVDLNVGANTRGLSENSATFPPGGKTSSNDRQFGLSASYEVDFWGRYARADEAARARLLSQGAARGTVLTTLYANIAQSYFAMRTLDAQLLLAERTLANRRETLKLQERRLQGGVIGELDLRQAQSEAISVEATVRAVRQNLRNAESALALLLGRKPAAILSPNIARGSELSVLFSAQLALGPGAVGVLSDVLNRRPDLISAEQNMIAAQADIAQARTAYFPKLTLTAGLGQQSKELGNLLSPSSNFWNLIGNLTQPVFRAGAIDATMAAANARQRQALAQYTQAVQSAFRDVADALTNIEAGRELSAITNKRLESLRASVRLADIRYKGGYSNYLEVLSAQRDLAQAESTVLDVQRAQLIAVVSFYKALGGGWDATTLPDQVSARVAQ